jgi:hypothetical protein
MPLGLLHANADPARVRTLTLASAAVADAHAGIAQRCSLHLHMQAPKAAHRREVLVNGNLGPDAVRRRVGLDHCDLGTFSNSDDSFSELVVQHVAGIDDVGFCDLDANGGIR